MGRGFRALAWMALLGTTGCPLVGEQRFDRDVRDADGDGFSGDRFGGPDCDDANPAVHPDAEDPPYDGVDQDCDRRDDFDADLDGFPLDRDCDDTRRDVHPEAEEICDGVDNDCDVRVDDADTVDDALLQTFHADLDGDGFGTEADVRACVAPPQHITRAGDCDDEDASIHPDAAEVCDAFDHDCDGDPEAGAIDATAWYPDDDGDGFGDGAAQAVVACAAPASHVIDRTDCDDSEPLAHPGADGLVEVCDGVDNDCDGSTDDSDPELLPSSRGLWFADADADGFGGGPPTLSCAAPPGAIAIGGDCDDVQPLVNPGAPEVCNTQDDDCDGLVDDGASNPALSLFSDGDGDGFGVNPVLACAPSPGVAPVGGDCDDANPRVRPGAPEICGDAVRQDCSGAPLDDCDGDGDPDALDCAEADPEVASTAQEICDGIDNDCDTLVDAADTITPVATAYFLDLDGDGWGSAVPAISVQVCVPPPNAVARQGDCDDTDGQRFPANPERCDALDNDCNGEIDDGQPADPPTFYRDVDRDGFGVQAEPYALGCAPPGALWAPIPGDCDDTREVIFPGADEVCDQRDNDCDALLDASDPDVLLAAWFRDADGDGAGSPSQTLASCEQPAGHVSNSADCNDTDPTVVGSGTYYRDADSDGFGDLTDALDTCSPPVGYVANALDCDDDATQVNPGQLEVCDATDNNCDGLEDEADPGLTGALALYVDVDGDGFGVGTAELRCSLAGHAYVGGDCLDDEPRAHPGALEDCKTGIDDDCSGTPSDGVQLGFADADGDGVGGAFGLYSCAAPAVELGGDCDDLDVNISDPTPGFRDVDADGFGAGTPITACPGIGFAGSAGDCDDLDPAVNPSATELCNGIDDDCDSGETDAPSLDGYVDVDGDGFGGLGALPYSCGDLQAVLNFDDCDDTSPSVFPGAFELCDTVDQDCDGDVDDSTASVLAWADGDDDGLGDPAAPFLRACDGSAGVLNDDDCDDTVDGPGGSTFYEDLDGDGQASATALPVTACAAPAQHVTGRGDCDDSDPSVVFAYADLDQDGLGDAEAPDAVCPANLTNRSLVPGDCWDATHPEAPYIGRAGQTLVLFPEGPLDVRNAIEQSCDGGTVLLTGGTYEAAATIAITDKALILRSVGDDSEILFAEGGLLLDGARTGTYIEGVGLRADPGATPAAGLVLQGGSNVIYAAGSIYGFGLTGMKVTGQSQITAFKVEIGFNGAGIPTNLTPREGGGLTVVSGEVTLLDSEIFENEASANHASAVWVHPDGTLELSESRLQDHDANGLDVIAVQGGFSATDTQITDNKPGPSAGVIRLSTGSDLTLRRSLLAGNLGTGLIGAGTVDIDQVTIAHRGALSWASLAGSTGTITRSVVVAQPGSGFTGSALVFDGLSTFGHNSYRPPTTLATQTRNPLWRYDDDPCAVDLDLGKFDTLRVVGEATIPSPIGGFQDVDDPWNQDIDGDDLEDGWELTWSNLDLVDANSDIDGDNLTAAEERDAGTDPGQPDSDADMVPDDLDLAGCPY